MQKRGKKDFATTNYTDVYLAAGKNSFFHKNLLEFAF